MLNVSFINVSSRMVTLTVIMNFHQHIRAKLPVWVGMPWLFNASTK